MYIHFFKVTNEVAFSVNCKKAYLDSVLKSQKFLKLGSDYALHLLCCGIPIIAPSFRLISSFSIFYAFSLVHEYTSWGDHEIVVVASSVSSLKLLAKTRTKTNSEIFRVVAFLS